MLIGGASALHHKIRYGAWEDEKETCHGKIGKDLFLGSLIVRIGCEILKWGDENKSNSGAGYESL